MTSSAKFDDRQIKCIIKRDFPSFWVLTFGRIQKVKFGLIPQLHLKTQARTENGADTNEDGDSVAWDGGVSLMADLSLSGPQTLMRCC